MFYDNLKNECERQHLKVCPTITECGGTSGMIHGWKKGAFPNSDIVMKLAERLNVSTDYLLFGVSSALSSELTEIVSPNQIPDNFLSDKANYILNDVRSKDLLRNYPFNISDLLEIGDIFDKSIDFMISGITNVSN